MIIYSLFSSKFCIWSDCVKYDYQSTMADTSKSKFFTLFIVLLSKFDRIYIIFCWNYLHIIIYTAHAYDGHGRWLLSNNWRILQFICNGLAIHLMKSHLVEHTGKSLPPTNSDKKHRWPKLDIIKSLRSFFFGNARWSRLAFTHLKLFTIPYNLFHSRFTFLRMVMRWLKNCWQKKLNLKS